MSGHAEARPAAVPARARRDGEAQAKWAWVEPSVWTERMLTALETGVKGGKWYSLMDKVYEVANLRAAFRKVKANRGAAGVDHQTIVMFEKNLERHLARLSEQRRHGTYRPHAIRRVWIPKPGRTEKRPLGIPSVRDRVAQGALRHVLEPIVERGVAEQSYGFRPHRGSKEALRRVHELLKAGYHYVVEVDVTCSFDTIPHQRLIARISEQVADGRVLELIAAYLSQDVLDGLEQWSPRAGSPQGAVVSPLLANIYLDPLDHQMARRGYQMVRYADDLVVLCRSEAAARQALEDVGQWAKEARLTLHTEKTRIIREDAEGFDFLGYHVERGKHWPSRRSLQQLRGAIREMTPRNNGQSLSSIIDHVNGTLRGWFEYFKHSHRYTFEPLDQWTRMRLRSILRKRSGRQGRGRGRDHQRWPNVFFAELGLFSLTAAHALACQSAAR